MSEKVGGLTLNHHNGTETFSVAEAFIYKFGEASEVELNFEVVSDGATKSLPDHEFAEIEPNMEFDIKAPNLNWDEFVGSVFHIPKGENGQDFVARLYYNDHQAVDQVEIRILEKQADRYRIAISGNTCDPITCDESKPPTKIELDAWFVIDN